MDGIASRGILQLCRATANPSGAGDNQLFLLQGDAASEIPKSIEMEPGVLPPAPVFPAGDPFILQVLHFNDLHGQLIRFFPDSVHSVISRMAWQISSSRKQSQDKPRQAVLALSAGDDCGGSIFDELLVPGKEASLEPPELSQDEKPEGFFHPYYRLYSRMGVDAACPGNHDFDHGIAFLAESIRREAGFPFLAANLKITGHSVIHPAAVMVLKGVRIGLIGLITRAETRISQDEGTIVDPRPVAQSLVDLLRPMCDILIILSHLGRSMEEDKVPMADCGDFNLARSLPTAGVDLIVGGHSHSELNRNGLAPENIVNGIPIVQAGSDGAYMGQVEIVLEGKGARVRSAGLIPTDSLPVKQDFEQREIKPLLELAGDMLSRRVGKVDTVEDISTKVVRSRFSAAELALANFTADALVERMAGHGMPVDFAMIDASTIQQGFSQDAVLTFGDCFEMMPYADKIRIYEMSGAEFQDLLYDNALRLHYPGEDLEERGFLQFSKQLRYVIESGSERGQSTVRAAVLDGIPLADQASRIFTAASTCFVRALSVVWQAHVEERLKSRLIKLQDYTYRETDFQLRREITAYIKAHGGITAEAGAVRDGRLAIKRS